MASKAKERKLEPGKGWLLFALCWAVTFLAVWGLRQALIPRDELDCYARVISLQKAVDRWNLAHPEKAVTDEIDEPALEAAGFFQPKAYDREKHYHFVGETAHGPRVKCNKHVDNPFVLRMTGVTLLSALLFVGLCVRRGYRLFDRA